MSERLDTVITWNEACDMFRDHILPIVIERYESDGIKDGPARRETWNDWTDGLCKDGLISTGNMTIGHTPTTLGA